MPRILIFCLFISSQLAASPVTLSSADPLMSLADKLVFLEDAEYNYDFEDVQKLNVSQWQPHDRHTFNQGYSDSRWWLKLSLNNPQSSPAERLLEISYPVLDYVEIFIVSDDQKKHFQLGDKQPFRLRPVDHRNFVVPLRWQPHETLDIYIKVKSSSSIQVPIQLWEANYFYDMDRTNTLIHGMYFGIMFVMALYNLFVYLAVGERNYIYYVMFVICMPTFLASLNGFAFQYLWPNATQWNDRAILVFLTLAVFFGSIFTQSFLNINMSKGITGKITSFILVGSILLVAMAFLLPYSSVILVVIGFACTACIYGVSMGFYHWYSGGLSAKYYSIAWSVLLLGGLILALNKNNILPKNLWTDYATQFGSALEVMLLSFALAERINQERRMRFEAQEEALKNERALRFAQEHALEVQKKATESLELRVQQRTQDLELLNQKLERLSDTDQLTGLRNRRFLDRTLTELLAHHNSTPSYLTVMLMDIDHFKIFNDTYGHQTGDRCLVKVARTIRSTVAECNANVARYGGEEFCVLIPDTEEQEAKKWAEKIRSNIESLHFIVGDRQIPVTISIGVATCRPEDSPTLEGIISNADKALYLAKALGRNRVEQYDNETTQALKSKVNITISK